MELICNKYNVSNPNKDCLVVCGFWEIVFGLCAGLTHKRKTQLELMFMKQMLVHKGGKIKNWGGECRDVTPTKLLSQNIFKESTGGGGVALGGGGQNGCEQRIKVFVKIFFFFFFFLFFFWGGGGVRSEGRGGEGVRVDVNREVKFL